MKKAIWVSILLMTLALTIPTFAEPATESTWVFMAGNINWYGNEGLVGWCGAFAKIDEWAEVYALWEKFQILPIPGNYTFYYARLANASIIKLDYTGKDFYILGEWDVLKVILVYDAHGNITRVTELLADDARGELSVTGNWSAFTISIMDPDVKLITGRVVFHRITSKGPIPRGDVKGPEINSLPDGEIDVYDLVHVAKAQGDTPGMGRYNFDIDFNFDFTIDIYDLTTLAVNFGEEY